MASYETTGIENQGSRENLEKPKVVLVICNIDNSSSSEYTNDSDLSFYNRIQESHETLLVHDKSRLNDVLLSGFQVEAVILNINDDRDLALATIAKGFFMGCPLLSMGNVTPEGFTKVDDADQVLKIMEERPSGEALGNHIVEINGIPLLMNDEEFEKYKSEQL